MSSNHIKIFFILCLSLGLITTSFAQRQTGSIKGIITDNEGNALPGCTVSLLSESLMGIRTYITGEMGTYRFPSLLPGDYVLKAELPGFKTVTRGNVLVRVGMVVMVDIIQEMTTIEEEVTIIASPPVIDVEQTKIVVSMDLALLRNLPMSRDIYEIVNFAPGAISEEVRYRRTSSIHGSTVRGNTYALDGVNMNDPVTMYCMTNVNFDVVEEVEMIMGAHPPEVGYTDGAYVNVVTRSGGNRFSGGPTLYYTDDSFVQQLWTDEQIQAMGLERSDADSSWFDGSFSLGGPILNDKLWFFSNIHYISQTGNIARYSYTDPYLGRHHGSYDTNQEEKMGFVKLTFRLTPNIRLMGMFNFVENYNSVWQPGSAVFQATQVWDHERVYMGNAALNFILDQNTFLEMKGGYVSRWFPLLLQEEARDLPRIRNFGAPYQYITTGVYNETYLRRRLQTEVHFTRFQDNFLGASHEFKGGLEFEGAFYDRDLWRKDNLYWYWRNDSPYYNGTTTWKGVSDVGKGRIYFYTCGPEQGSFELAYRSGRISAYIQDSVTFADRLTLNLGIRFDRSWGWNPAFSKAACGNPVSIHVGENYVMPYTADRYPEIFPEGINPFGELRTQEWKDLMVWNSWSPRIGLSFDIFGSGKTVLKATFSRYTEYMMVAYYTYLHPLASSLSLRFDWYDMNFNQQVDTGDDFEIYPVDYRTFDSTFSANKLDPNVKSPLTDEFTAGIQQELFKNFSLGVNFIYKDKKNILETGLYDPDTGEWWYHMNQAGAQKYWVPFTAVVPSEDYGDRTVTFYVRKNDAPDIFYRASNLPELKRKYWALEFLFDKRMAEGWQFSGSVVYSKAYGNADVWFLNSDGNTGYGNSPNTFVNTYGRLSVDTPLQIKLMGTIKIPFGIFFSAYYQYFSGRHWVRDASIMPPSAWCKEHDTVRESYSVNIEDPSQPRRTRSWNTLDLRLEKEFRIGDLGRLGMYADVSNVLGWTDSYVESHDIQYYYPVAENDNTGRVVQYNVYGDLLYVLGTTEARFGIRFSF